MARTPFIPGEDRGYQPPAPAPQTMFNPANLAQLDQFELMRQTSPASGVLGDMSKPISEPQYTPSDLDPMDFIHQQMQPDYGYRGAVDELDPIEEDPSDIVINAMYAGAGGISKPSLDIGDPARQAAQDVMAQRSEEAMAEADLKLQGQLADAARFHREAEEQEAEEQDEITKNLEKVKSDAAQGVDSTVSQENLDKSLERAAIDLTTMSIEELQQLLVQETIRVYDDEEGGTGELISEELTAMGDLVYAILASRMDHIEAGKRDKILTPAETQQLELLKQAVKKGEEDAADKEKEDTRADEMYELEKDELTKQIAGEDPDMLLRIAQEGNRKNEAWQKIWNEQALIISEIQKNRADMQESLIKLLQAEEQFNLIQDQYVTLLIETGDDTSAEAKVNAEALLEQQLRRDLAADDNAVKREQLQTQKTMFLMDLVNANTQNQLDRSIRQQQLNEDIRSAKNTESISLLQLISDRELAQSALQEQSISRLQNYMLAQFQAMLTNPYAYGALRMLSGGDRTSATGLPGQMNRGLAPLGFLAPDEGTTPGSIADLFQGMIPTVGAISQADPESLRYLDPLMGYMGISPDQFASAATTYNSSKCRYAI
jgi:hypothetical protein